MTFTGGKVYNPNVGVVHGEFPHQVSLQATDQKNHHFCGASIISPNFLLTAAHCFVGTTFGLPHVQAVAGDHHLEAQDGNREQTRRVTHLITHEDFNAKTWDNDIALLQLDTPLNFDNKYVRSIERWDSNWALPRKKS